MSDRSIAPGPRRLHDAWRAGLRTRPRWIGAGFGCLAVAVAAELGGPAAARCWAEWFEAGLAEPPLQQAAWVWVLLLGCGFAVALLGAVAVRSFGAVSDRRDPTLPTGIRSPTLVMSVLVGVALAVLLGLVAPVAAGAARAPDASEVALTLLWARWATHLFGTSGLLLLAAGVAEHLVMRNSLWRDLHMTLEQAREQARRHGGAGG